jgi:hypothetical protein
VTETHLRGWQDDWWGINMERFDDDEPEPDEEPPLFEPLVVTASNGNSVTIGDYVAAVHPWLMERRALILRARLTLDHVFGEDPADERLVVSVHNTRVAEAKVEEEWRRRWRLLEDRRTRMGEGAWCRGCGYLPPEEAAKEAQGRLPEGWVAVGFEA